ncbi:hypothetical protein AB1Y20_011319 [Prymnesium parvum]|uniref:Uncharacterized protein n=1 Tax=Prymnesium parvum TaxID=97485 RepID=A0AB34IP79_PRYPA
MECALLRLPAVLLLEIAAHLLPRQLNAPAAAWRAALRLAASCRAMLHAVLPDAVCLRFPLLHPLLSDAPSPTRWLQLVASVQAIRAHACWLKLRPLRPLRPPRQPLAPPPLAGATLCFMESERLVLYGGSTDGEPHGAAYLCTLCWFPTPLAQWDLLPAPPPRRRFHSASRTPSPLAEMIVFGGRGAANTLLDDAWLLRLASGPADAAVAQWRRLPRGEGSAWPCERASHVTALWEERGSTVLHGGHGARGTLSDTWLLDEASRWSPLETHGAKVARAHHCGGVLHDRLLVYAGQDDQLLSVESVCVLALGTAVWSELTLEQLGSRLDASAAAIPGVGLLVFGGVGGGFGFEAPTPWLVDLDAPSARALASPWQHSPHARACSALCAADRLRVFLFGGFDGQTDLHDLWCLSLAPSAAPAASVCFGEADASRWLHQRFLQLQRGAQQGCNVPAPPPSTGRVPRHLFANAAKCFDLVHGRVAASYPRVWQTAAVVESADLQAIETASH